MKADLTRNTFQPWKHFTRVLMQQGRVQLDADLNEQTSILLHYLRTLAADLIGPAGGNGLAISPLPITPTINNDFRIGEGHYYVNGILCEAQSVPIRVFALNPPSPSGVVQVESWSLDGLDLQNAAYSSPQGIFYLELFDDTSGSAAGTPVSITNFDHANNRITLSPPVDFGKLQNPKLRRYITYLHQPGFMYSDQPNNQVPPPLTGSPLQVYLDVWERAITYVEDDSIREVALGGPDTAARAQLVWQVKTTSASDATGSCMTIGELNQRFQPPNRGRLKARAKQGSTSGDPCIISPTARYRGPENQLYRVEINRPGPAADAKNPDATNAATFKWSRENGSVAFAISSGGNTNKVVLESLGRDERFGLSQGDWVEVEDDNAVLLTRPGTLRQVLDVDAQTMTVTLDGTPDPTVGGDPALHPLLRRWDQKPGDPAEFGLTLGTDNAALVIENTWLELEDGVQIFFQPWNPVQPSPAGAVVQLYRTADYWLIPARTATGDVEWPRLTAAGGSLEVDSDGNPIPLAQPPRGVTHYYAPLAVITVDQADGISIGNGCRQPFDTVVSLSPANK